MSGLQGPGSQNDPGDYADLGAVLRSLSGRLDKLERRDVLGPSGIIVSPDGMTIDTQLHVTGDTIVDGTLSLPAGIIDNDALSSPLRYEAGLVNSGALNLTMSEQTICTHTITVPPGFTQALIMGQGSIGVVNPSPFMGSIGGRVYIDDPVTGSWWGPRRFQGVTAGWDGAVNPYDAENFTVTGGTVITVRLVALTAGSAWGATPGGGTLNVTAFFTR
jgi:hypothetical protein